MHDRRAHRPRILQLVTHDRLGGVRTLVKMVEAGLSANGFDVETLPLNSERGTRYILADLAHVARKIFTGRYDAVLTYQAAASVLGNTFAWMSRTPLRVAHQTASPEGIRPHWRLLDRILGSSGVYSHIISNSSATTASFHSWPRAYLDRFILIPHGVDALPEAGGSIDWRARLSISDDARVLVATGRLVGQKNQVVAIEAMARLPNTHLVIAGDGPDHDMLVARARTLGVAERLHLVGPIRRDDLGDLLVAGDAYVFPSVWETFGLAGVEAAMARLPIVASDLPVLREVLDIGPAGMVRFHDMHDATAMAEAIEQIFAAYPNQATREQFAATHRNQHSRARMIEQYRDFLLKASVG